MCPKDADGIVNRVDTTRTAPLRAYSDLDLHCTQAYLSENIGSLRYLFSFKLNSLFIRRQAIYAFF